MSENLSAFKVKIRNHLVEFGVEPFVVIGFKGQDEVVVQHFRGGADLRAINCLIDENYKEWFEPDDGIEFEEDENFWEED